MLMNAISYNKSSMASLRVQILFHPLLYLASIGPDLILQSQQSHLGLLNSVELIKQNTSSQQALKVGESFYIQFHATGQYISYNSNRDRIGLTRNQADRTLFKILTDEFDWRSGGRFQLNCEFKYRIILAEYNGKCLGQANNKIVASTREDQNSLIAFDQSQYSKAKHPASYRHLQSSLTLSYINSKLTVSDSPSLSSCLFCVESNKTNDRVAMRHVDSRGFLVQIGSDFMIMKNPDERARNIFHLENYDEDGQYIFLQLGQEKYLGLNDKKQWRKCGDKLSNAFREIKCSEILIKNVVVSAWLRTQLSLPVDPFRIEYILTESCEIIKELKANFDKKTVRDLIEQGLILQLEAISQKYPWAEISKQVFEIISVILEINSDFLGDILQARILYWKLMNQKSFQKKVSQIRICDNKQCQRYLGNAQKLIEQSQQINLKTLYTILSISKLLMGPNNSQELKKYSETICMQMVDQLRHPNLSPMFMAGLQLLYAQTKRSFFNEKVIPNLSFELLNSSKADIEDALRFIEILDNEGTPLLYFVSEDQELASQIKNQNALTYYVEEVLTKNCRFEVLDSKIISFALTKYEARNSENLDDLELKQRIGGILSSFVTYCYDESPEIFICEGLKCLNETVKRLAYCLSSSNIKYDSLTIKTEERVKKCKNQLDEIITLQSITPALLWNFFTDEYQSGKSPETQQSIFVELIQLNYTLATSQAKFAYYIESLKSIDDASDNFKDIMTQFRHKTHIHQPSQFAQQIIDSAYGLSELQLSSIGTTIHQNNLIGEFMSSKTDSIYEMLSTLIVGPAGRYLNGVQILQELENTTKWTLSDAEYIFLKNILVLIGGIVSFGAYEFYQEYLCAVPLEHWSYRYLKLCSSFFDMSPINARKSFSVTFQESVREKASSQKISLLLRESKQNFVLAFIKLLSNFSATHVKPDLIYKMCGDEILFFLLAIYPQNINLQIEILKFMIQARPIAHTFEEWNPAEDMFWLKQGTSFISKLLKTISVIKETDFFKLQTFTYIMIDFLKGREQLVELGYDHDPNQMLIIEGTNKMMAFELVDLLENAVTDVKIEKAIFEKIQWFESTYKINVNSVELTQLAGGKPAPSQDISQFTFKYQLEVEHNLADSVREINSRITPSLFFALLIRSLSEYVFCAVPNWSNVQLLLSYLHFITSQPDCPEIIEKDFSILFFTVRRLFKKKKRRLVALLLNCLRKCLQKYKMIDNKHQLYLQGLILQYKQDFFDYLHDVISEYTTFSPLYSHTFERTYFNMQGEDQINWTITGYLSMLRFMISLNKSLQIGFKGIFSQVTPKQIEIVGKLVEINSHHIKIIKQLSSKTTLTIVAYQIELINNLLRGPVETNIEVALKYQYDQILTLVTLPDNHDNPEMTNQFKIILKIKKLVSDVVMILSPFYKYKEEEIKKIEEAFSINYDIACQLFGAAHLDKAIIKYSKQNKETTEFLVFDLTLSLFYGLITTYEQRGDLTIKRLRASYLQQARLIKSYNKRFKMFYQLYRVLAELFSWIAGKIVRCCRKTAQQIDEAVGLIDHEEQSWQQGLNKGIAFFIKHVASIEIQIGEQIQVTHFLLLKETKCYNASIRKQLHRRVGLGDRKYRLSRFLEASNHIILRLEIQKSIKTFTEKYKPFDIIIKNRQLWKSMNFLCACLLNFLFLQSTTFPNVDIPLAIVRGLCYIFCIFLFIIYFIQNLPLKRKLARLLVRNQKGSKFRYLMSCLQFFNDKTLWFATIYFTVICLSFYQLGFVALLMIDFFVRFKISKKVTQIVTRPIIQLILIILFSVTIAFVYTCYEYFINSDLACKNTSSCIQMTYEEYLGLYRGTASIAHFDKLRLRNFTDFIFSFFSIMVSSSMLIGVLIYEKKSKSSKNKDWEFQVKKKCFICDAERSSVDRNRNNNKGFFQHIEEEHNLWNYVFYLIYLKNKEASSLNIVESKVLEQWHNNQFEWMPNRCRD